jgi:hypothetical protein
VGCDLLLGEVAHRTTELFVVLGQLEAHVRMLTPRVNDR